MAAVRDVSTKIVCADRAVDTRRSIDPGETLYHTTSTTTPFLEFRLDFLCSIEDCA